MIDLSTPLNRASFVSVDVETTGLHPRRDVIVEVAAVQVLDGKIREQFSTLVCIDRTIPYEAQRVHGITNQMLIGHPRISEAMSMFQEFAVGGTLVEHSWKSFDAGFLEAAMGRAWDGPYINTCTLSRKLFPFHRSHSLAECCKRHKIANDQAHRALSDARATAQLLLCLLEACSLRYPRLQDLVPVCSIER